MIATLTETTLAPHHPLRQELHRWLIKARAAGSDNNAIEALFQDTLDAKEVAGDFGDQRRELEQAIRPTGYALNDCTLAIPAGRVVGLVGTERAGKSTLLQLALGLIAQRQGSIEVLGDRPVDLRRVGYVAGHPRAGRLCRSLTICKMGRRLNPAWDSALAQTRVADLGLDPGQRAGGTVRGTAGTARVDAGDSQATRVAHLDEPTAALDPLARRSTRARWPWSPTTTSASSCPSHLLSDLARYLITSLSSPPRKSRFQAMSTISSPATTA